MKFPLNLNFFSKGKKDLDNGKDDDFEDEGNGEEEENGEEEASRFGGLIAKLKIDDIIAKLKIDDIVAKLKIGDIIAKLKDDKRLAIMVAGGAVAVLAVIVGGSWLLMGGEESAQKAETPSDAGNGIVEISSGAKVVQRVPPRGNSSSPADGLPAQPQGQFSGAAPATGPPGGAGSVRPSLLAAARLRG